MALATAIAKPKSLPLAPSRAAAARELDEVAAIIGQPTVSRWRRRPFRSLTWRILAVNILALATLVAGLLYLDEFRRGLVDAKTDSLFVQAEMIAGALGEGTVKVDGDRLTLDLDAVAQMLPRLVAPADARARIFDSRGSLIVDSRRLAAAARGVESRALPPPEPEEWLAVWFSATVGALRLFLPAAPGLPRYFERVEQGATDYAEVIDALTGERGYAHRVNEDGHLVVSVALPVQRFKQVTAALLLSTTAPDIERNVREVRVAILRVSAATLAITVLLSLYLAGTIARPIRALAAAADRVRRGSGRSASIPNFAGRGDEIEHLSRAFIEMTEALHRRLYAIESFAADVAHELRNPLTSVKSATETFARTADPDKQRHLLGIIASDLKRLDRLISDISDASRLDTELQREAYEPVDMAALVRVYAEIYAATIDPNSPSLEVEVASNQTLLVAGIEDRLGQVVRNLVTNAVSFSPSGGTIMLRVAASDDCVELVVADCGPGVPNEQLERIFERFYSSRPASEMFGKHSGLGLSISRQIVEAHGGVIRAENRGDSDMHTVGARFVVTIPKYRPN
ncbi:MAG: HAMP domain-containing protein [Alphaproteobacteria bacterium]|nr:HAMP domain-containing protein [Alphaproteobacteria bacterium]